MKKINPERELLKAEKSRFASLYTLHNHIMSAWSIKRISTYKDLLVAAGYDDEHINRYFPFELERKVVLNDVKEFLKDIEISVKTELFLKRNPPERIEDDKDLGTNDLQCNNNEIKNQAIDKEGSLIAVGDLQEVISTDRIMAQRSGQTIKEEEEEEEEELPPSPHEKAFLFWFQKKAAKQVLDNLVKYNLHGQLLVAAAGLGKTYIYGAVIRRLLDMQFHVGKTISPWPYCIITKASVVEQTKRVLRDDFGIDTIYQCMVTSYDQMRATFGKLFVIDKTRIINGEEVIEWEWNPGIHPCVFILDESQAAKNETSQQSQIIVSISKIKTEHVYTVFVSATPFTRVSESKYFVLNTKHNEKGMII